MRWPLLSAMARAIDTASVRASKATAAAMGAIWRKASSEKSGRENGGKPMLKAPMLAMPVLAAPSRWLSASATRLPTTMPTIMWGRRGTQRLAATQASTVTTATLVTAQLMAPACSTRPLSTCQTEAPRGRSMPKKFFTWLIAISTAAPEVKPTTTVCDTKLIRLPRRSTPSSS